LFENINIFLVCHLFPSCLLCEHATLLKRLYSLLLRSGSVTFLRTHLEIEWSYKLAGKLSLCCFDLYPWRIPSVKWSRSRDNMHSTTQEISYMSYHQANSRFHCHQS